MAEVTCVTQNGGWIVCCDGDDGFRSTTPNDKLISRGFEYFGYKTRRGSNAYKNLYSQALNAVWPGLLPPCCVKKS